MAKYEQWINPEGLARIGGWARDGLTNIDIAHNIGISHETFNVWRKKYPDFAETLKESRDVADRRVENALYKAATGYHYKEETVTNTGKVVTVEKYSKPNTTAMIFWLKNRKREEWRDKQEIEQTNKNIEINVGDWDDS